MRGQADLLLHAQKDGFAPDEAAVGDDRLHGRADLGRGVADGVAAHDRGAAGHGRSAVRHARGVGVHDLHQLHGQPSASAVIWLSTVIMPWPISVVPTATLTLPSAATTTLAPAGLRCLPIAPRPTP